MRPQSDCSGCTDQNQAASGPSEWMTVAEMQEYMHAGRTKAYELIKAGEENPAIPGVTKAAVEYALAAMKKQPEKGDLRVVSEDWGDMDEADW